MTAREKGNAIFKRTHTGEAGFWTGHPNPKTWDIYLNETGMADREAFFNLIDDECRWIRPGEDNYVRTEGAPPWFDAYLNVTREKGSLSEAGCFAEATSVAEIDAYPWPDPACLQFDDIIKRIDAYPDTFVFTGFWSPFFHVMCDFFGMENLFMKMYTDADVVEHAFTRCVDFYVEANDRYFSALGARADVFFFGNDLGSQLDLLISPDMFNRFVLPGIKRLTAVAKKHGKLVMQHSCGSIAKVIPSLIDAGVDALHPLQAKAAGMDAETLGREYKNDVAFVGGIDTQDLLVNASAKEIEDEVYRVRECLGDNVIISPSHEAVLPNVPFTNIEAMARASRVKRPVRA